jgi:hypothetical protein
MLPARRSFCWSRTQRGYRLNTARALSDVVYAPLGRYLQPSAWRKSVSGILKSTLPVFWNVQKA